MSLIKTPFSDAIGPSTVPKTSSHSVEYDAVPGPDLPKRSMGPDSLKEVTFDKAAGDPKLSGPIKKSPFKDAVS